MEINKHNQNKPNILVIDDEESFHKNFRYSFGDDYDLTSVKNEQDALSALQTNDYDAIVVDLSLEPNHSDYRGLELIKKMKGKAPILAVSNHKQSTLAKARNLGAESAFSKRNYNYNRWKNKLDDLSSNNQAR
jgi:CheY-like chemotaxis protein